ncbi:hypothetical protein Tco_1250106 [Tanacetum coccineum]
MNQEVSSLTLAKLIFGISTSASGSHLLTWMPRGLPHQWQLANQLSLRGGSANKSDINTGTRLTWRLADTRCQTNQRVTRGTAVAADD